MPIPASELPRRLVDACAAALAVTGAAIIWMTDRGPGSMLAGTNDTAAVLENLQFTLGEGPCVDASARGRTVSVPDLTADGPRRWPGFSAGALEAGVCAVFAVPLQVGGIRVGVLDLHRTEAGGLGSGGLLDAFAFAEAATALLLYLQGQDSAEADMDRLLEGPSRGRAVVHQATGMVAVQLAVPLSEALVRLRARSYSQERPIVEVARDVVARLVRFDD
jgi:GAF domain-containing protein